MEIKTVRIPTGTPGDIHAVMEVSDGVIVNAEVCSSTTPLAWETLVLEKHPEFAIVAAERVCAGCDASAGLAVAEAIENALEVQVPDAATEAREALNAANTVRSHATSLLKSDLDLDADALYTVIKAAKKVLHALGRKPDHPPAITPGGLELETIPTAKVENAAKEALETAEKIKDDTTSAVDDLKDEIQAEMNVETYGEPGYKADLTPDDVEIVPPDEFYRMKSALELANNHVALVDGNPTLVGPQARKNLTDHPLDAYTAKAEEIVESLEKIAETAENLDPNADVKTDVEYTSGEGHAAVEAPEGTLLVTIKLRNDRVDEALMVTPSNVKAAVAGRVLKDLEEEHAPTVIKALGLSGRCLTH
jgi:coenzyme F420 hydrogenase subunit alpha